MTERSAHPTPRGALTRRGFIASTAAAGAALAIGGHTTYAAAADTLKVGFISPRTGPLGGFGEGDGYILDLAKKALAGGLKVGDKTYAVTIIDQDTQSDPARAGQLAKDLINNQGIDMMLTTSTPEVVNPVSDACEAAGVPCIGTIVPWEAFYFGRGAKPGQPSPFKWTYCFSFGTGTFAKTYLSMWPQVPTNKKIGVMYPNDADGNAIRAALGPLLEKGGYTLVDPGAYEDGTTDYSAQIQKFKDEGVEIFNTFPIPPDFAAFWHQAAQQGLTKQIKIAQIAKTGLFPSDIEAVGDLGDKLATAAYWHPTFPYKSSLTGIAGKDLADGYTAASGKQWQQQLGASLSLLDAGFAALAASGNPNDKASVAKAISTLNTTTIVGKVDFTSGPVPNVSETPIIGAQWVKAASGSKFQFDLVIVDNAPDPNVPIAAKLLAYNS
ncbi:MAG TPA: ABC transporter substrate-binding protein [Devosia sp.]|jgi:branched-chain amino acid transport system substrate-binding protein|nr:ABC transporter substrate-binding protein [Devosia sp.]